MYGIETILNLTNWPFGAYLLTIKMALPGAMDTVHRKTIHQMTIPMGAKEHIRIPFDFDPAFGRVTQEYDLENSGIVLCIGRIIYTDNSRHRHETGFCRVKDTPEYEYAY